MLCLSYLKFGPNYNALESLVWLSICETRFRPVNESLAQIGGYLQQLTNNWFDLGGLKRRLRDSIAWRSYIPKPPGRSADPFLEAMIYVLNYLEPQGGGNQNQPTLQLQAPSQEVEPCE